MPTLLKNLQVNEISAVDHGANPHAKISFFKSDTRDSALSPIEKRLAETYADNARIKKRAREYKQEHPSCKNREAVRAALDDLAKSAPGQNRYDHGRVQTTGRNFSAPPDTGGKIERDGIEGGEEGNNYLTQMADVPRKQRRAIAIHANKLGITLAQAKKELMQTK